MKTEKNKKNFITVIVILLILGVGGRIFIHFSSQPTKRELELKAKEEKLIGERAEIRAETKKLTRDLASSLNEANRQKEIERLKERERQKEIEQQNEIARGLEERDRSIVDVFIPAVKDTKFPAHLKINNIKMGKGFEVTLSGTKWEHYFSKYDELFLKVTGNTKYDVSFYHKEYVNGKLNEKHFAFKKDAPVTVVISVNDERTSVKITEIKSTGIYLDTATYNLLLLDKMSGGDAYKRAGDHVELSIYESDDINRFLEALHLK